MDFNWKELERNYQSNQSRDQAAPKKQDNALLAALPSALAAAASFIPGVGTIAGGLIGGAGEAGRQLISGERFDAGKVAGEAALSAIPFGIGKAGKIIGAAKKATGVGNKAKAIAGAAKPTEISTLQKLRPGNKSGSSVEEVTKDVTLPEAPATVEQPNLLDKFARGAKQTNQAGLGLTVGQNQGRGRVLTPDKADDMYNFMTTTAQKYGGIRSGKPIDQAYDAQNVLNNVTKSLDDTLTSINRQVKPEEIQAIGSSVIDRIGRNALITGKSSPTAQKLISELENAKDLKSLEAIRRKADDIAFTQNGAGKTSAAAQAKDVRDSIDEFITPLSDDYKAIKGDYSMAKEALESTSKANKSAKGVKIPLIDKEVGKQAIPGVINKVSSVASGAQGSSLFNKIKGGARFAGELAKQGATRSIAGPILNPSEEPDPTELTDASLLPETPIMNTEAGDSGAISQGQLMAAIAADPKNADTYITLYKLFNEGQGAKKPMSAESAKTLSNAQTGLSALDQIEGQLQSDPSIQQRGGISGAFNPFGAVSGVLGTGEYENARGQARDIIARIRTGAALTNDEAKAFDKFLPQPGDSQSTVQQKLGTLRSQFQYIMDNAGGAGTDLQGAL